MILRTVVTIAVATVILLSGPVSFAVAVFGLPPQFDSSYYGALGHMVDKLDNADGKKIIIVGTSSVAFGVDSALLESQLAECGYDYTVCNFGLYGALGTKLMLDISRTAVCKGDIVLFAPEPNEQTMSLYFSARETWRAMDGNFDMLWRLDCDDIGAMAGNFVYFASEKFSAWKSGTEIASGIYASASFDENGDLKNFPRPHNIMNEGYDVNTPMNFSDIGDNAFFEYVNDYYSEVTDIGASMYYVFCPMNAAAFTGNEEDELASFADRLAANLLPDILGDPLDAVMEAGWFYDTNFHLNESGMTVNTIRILDLVKLALGDTLPTDFELPEMPELGVPPSDPADGDNTDSDCFLYSDEPGGLRIVGLTDKGRNESELVVPCVVDGKNVVGFDASVFAGNDTVASVTLQENIRSIADYSFDGCKKLQSLILLHTEGSSIRNVGFHLLAGAPDCTVYVPSGSIGSYMGEYIWSYYFTEGRVAELI